MSVYVCFQVDFVISKTYTKCEVNKHVTMVWVLINKNNKSKLHM